MKKQLSIFGPLYKYKYLIEYNKIDVKTNTTDVYWYKDEDDIRLFTDDVKYYKKYNDWYLNKTDANKQHSYLPDSAHITNVKLYIPNFAAHIHMKGIKYMVSFNTWINGIRIDLGSFMFKPTDTKAIKTGILRQGNNEFFEYVSFNILDPYYLMYSDDWEDFRTNVCNEPKGINSTPSSLYATLYIVNEYENRYTQHNEFVGSCTNFIVADEKDIFGVGLDIITEPKLGFRFNVNMNSNYDWLLTYFKETYNLDLNVDDILFNIIIKNNDSAVEGPTVSCTLSNSNSTTGHYFQDIYWDSNGLDAFKLFFSSWNDFEEGWYFVGSMTLINRLKDDGKIYEDYESQIFLTNDVIITQDIYSLFVNGGTEKIDMTNLVVDKYSIINKLVHDIIAIDRPTLSINDYNNITSMPFRIKRPDKFNIHKTYTRPLIKCNN